MTSVLRAYTGANLVDRPARGSGSLDGAARAVARGAVGGRRGEETPRSRRGNRAQGPRRVLRSRRRARSEERRADDQGRHLPPVLDDQAVRLRRGDDVRRGRLAPATTTAA